ncbi:hypothetical protein CPC08DRAFT_705706 [Agrocybe pediades]|nr:hypothetical protein CPC08DRAFT_705706 [Agrocybe pediades]
MCLYTLSSHALLSPILLFTSLLTIPCFTPFCNISSCLTHTPQSFLSHALACRRERRPAYTRPGAQASRRTSCIAVIHMYATDADPSSACLGKRPEAARWLVLATTSLGTHRTLSDIHRRALLHDFSVPTVALL